jgi:hypothetical protein
VSETSKEDNLLLERLFNLGINNQIDEEILNKNFSQDDLRNLFISNEDNRFRWFHN